MATIRVQLEQQEAAYHFQASNDAGFTVDMDDATAYPDGRGNGVGPMQLLIMAVGGCSGVDIVSILAKSRQELTSFGMDVTGERPDGVAPALYSRIHVHYRLKGALEEAKVRRAIHLSLEKYCSVAKTLEPSADITYSFEVNGTRFDN